MKTAEEFLQNSNNINYHSLRLPNPLIDIMPFIEADLIEFAKMHVQEALRIASDGDLNCSCDSWESCRNKFPTHDILNCYPLENIN